MAGVLGFAPDRPSPALDARILARSITRQIAEAQERGRKRRLLALAVRAYHAERAALWYREAARLTPDREAALPLIWAALAAEEVAERADRESGYS